MSLFSSFLCILFRVSVFFKDHWGDLLRAGLSSVEKHGPALLVDEDPLLGKILSSVAGNLASRPDNKFLTRETLVGIVDTVVGTVAANPDRINDILSDDWLAALVNSVAGTMSNEEILSQTPLYVKKVEQPPPQGGQKTSEAGGPAEGE